MRPRPDDGRTALPLRTWGIVKSARIPSPDQRNATNVRYARRVTRNTRDDVIEAAGKLFAERGFHGTSMRDLGSELGLLGSSLYSHVGSKQELLIEVIERGARFFQASADAASANPGGARIKLADFIRGHLDVVLDHPGEVRTFLNEARFLDEADRSRAMALRDRYEASLRAVLSAGSAEGAFKSDLDPRLGGIVVLSILNAVERWYREDGPLNRDALSAALTQHIVAALQ